MKKGEVAPFAGVLLPEDAYRFYQLDAELYGMCDERLRASVGLCRECEPSFGTGALIFTLGIIVGGYAAWETHR